MSSTTMTLRLDPSIKDQLQTLAEATHRSAGFLAVEAIKDYLNRESWQVREIKKGLAEVKAGELISHEEVVKQWKERHADSLVKKS